MSTTRMGRPRNCSSSGWQLAVSLFIFAGLLQLVSASGVSASTQLTHGSANIGSTQFGEWGADYTCDTCHSKGQTANVRKVKSVITTPTGNRPVVFTRTAAFSNFSTGVFGNDERAYDQQASKNVCEVCHHRTKYHQYSASKLADKEHTEHRSSNRDCMKCHSHRFGFRPPQPGDCLDCHGNPPVPGTQLQTDVLAFAPGQYGAHQKHYYVLGLNCTTCHNASVHGLLGNEFLEFGFRIDSITWPTFAGSITGGTLTINSNATYPVMVRPESPDTTIVRAPDVMNCTVYCHGDGWGSNKLPGSVSWVQGALPACSTGTCHGTTKDRPPMPSVTVGAHPRHVGTNDFACTTCHDAYGDPHMVNGRVKWNLSSQGPSATYKGFNAFSTNYPAGTLGNYGSCSTTYCHSNVQSGASGTQAADSYKTVTWGGANLQCDGCHNGLKTDAAPIASGSHAKHVSVYGYTCTECHYGSGKSIETKHADSNIDVAFTPASGGSYTQSTNVAGDGYGSCSASYCHSNGKGGTVTVAWGGAPLSCTSCHQGDLASGAPIASGMHPQHINQEGVLGYNFGCVECHANTVSSNTAIGTAAKHVNTLADYSGARAGSNRTACNAAYCHSDGKGTPGAAVSWTTGPALGCAGCHGNDPAPAFTSLAGEPNYANAGIGQERANSHQRHMGGKDATSCIYCHNNTVDAAGVLKTGTLHLDGTRSVAAGAGRTFNYSPASKTCDNISCHGGPSPIQWGGSMPADCTGCHGNNASSSIPQTSGKHKAHMNNYTTLGQNYRCVACHALTINPDDRSIADQAFHGNGFKNITGVLVGGRSSYTTATGVCSVSYCHSDGKGKQNVPFTLANGWKSTATLDCKGCHGNDTAPEFASVAGEPNYASSGPASLRANNHRNHADTGVSSCSSCHSATVNGTAVILANVSTHTNRRIDVVAGAGHTFTYEPANKSCSDISCHGGKGSFTQSWGNGLTANCLGCHGNNVASGTPIALGSHTAHVNNAAVIGANFNCAECHAKTINADERSFANAVNHGNGYKNYSGLRAGSDTAYNTVTGVCSASYCHTDGKGTQKMTAAAGWRTGTTFDCSGCHGADSTPDFASAAGEPNYASTGGNQPRSNSHKKHVGTTGQAATCVFCHSTTVNSAGTAIINNHLDRTIQLAAGGGKSFTPGAGKTCSNISCHGAGSPAATWGATFPADCSGCHGTASTLVTGQHGKHLNQASVLGDNLSCASCHANTVSANTTISNAANHGNEFANYSGLYAGKNKAACNAAYCHSDGKGTPGAAVIWASGPALNCSGCHGNDPAPDFTGTSGAPNYVNAGAGQFKSNSHKKHTAAGASTCDTCHTNTVTADGTAIKAGSSHLNQSINVNFNAAKATAVWDGLNKTCNNISCHGGNNATWGDPNSAGCTVCHGVLSGVHAIHVGNYLALGTSLYGNYSANRSTGAIYRFGCANCHPTDPSKHQNSVVDVTLNKNKSNAGSLITRNNLVSSDSAGYTRGGATNFTCETVYCHSNGRTADMVAGDYRQTPNWYGGTFGANRCGGCHDNPPQYAGQSHYVTASSLGNNGTPPYRDTGHMINIHFKSTSKGNNRTGFLGFSSAGDKAHGNPAVATTISCYTCHSGIVSSSQVDTYALDGKSSSFKCANCHNAGSPTPLQTGLIVDTSRHVNGTKNVAFAPITFKTKAQIVNVNNIIGWSRDGGYKGTGSYDSFDLTTSTWDAQTKTCMTLCHVNQPGITWGAQLKCNSCHAKQ